jgi:hypothetical protein
VARLAGGPLRTSAARGLLAGSRRVLTLGGGLRLAGAAGGPLLGLDPPDGGVDLLPVGPLGRIIGLGAEGPLRVGDVVGASVLLDLGRGLAPGPSASGRRWHRAQGLQDAIRPLLLDG